MGDPRIETLTAAFFHDPLSEFLLPEAGSRTKGLSTGLDFVLGLSAKTWTVATANKECAGVIGASPPEEYPPPFFQMMAVLTKLILKSLSFAPYRVMEQWVKIFNKFDKIRPRQPHWYILVLGVHPDHQRKGLGGVLLRQVLRKADEDGIAVYLESSNRRNLDFYSKHGFEVIEQIVPVAACPPIWGLLRGPASNEETR